MKITKKTFIIFFSGLLIGILISAGVFGLRQCGQTENAAQTEADAQTSAGGVAQTEEDAGLSAEKAAQAEINLETEPDTGGASVNTEQVSDTQPANQENNKDDENSTGDTWSPEAVYNGDDEVAYHGKIYRAKWWTQNEEPGKADVWEDTLIAAEQPDNLAGELGQDIDAEEREQEDAAGSGEVLAGGQQQKNTTLESEPVRRENFKVVGYFPSWKENTEKIHYDVLTHINYAFAIPTAEGGLLPLENDSIAQEIIKEAHEHDVKVFIAVGGWSYHDVPLESTFMSATETKEKRTKLADALLAMCKEYGFDGVDLDWEHPRVDGSSSAQYEALVVELAEKLHAEGKELSSAVLSGVTADGNVYYDAAAHTDKVLETVDWINVMAYDGGDGERHSAYDFAVNCGTYWTKTREMPAEKVILGVPFYARPSWAAYGDILASVPDAWKVDHTDFNGMDVWYNGVSRIEKKTAYALEHLGGVMIWEITQDASGEYSLQTAIKNVINEN